MKIIIGFIYGAVATTVIFLSIAAFKDAPPVAECPAPHATSTVPAAEVPDEVLIIPDRFSPPEGTPTTVIYPPTTTERVTERETRIEKHETNNTKTVREVEAEPDEDPQPAEDNDGLIDQVIDIL